MEALLNRLERVGIFFLIYSLVFFIFFSTLPYTLPFVLAILFALILKKPTAFLIKKFKLKPWISSLITTIIFFVVFISLIVLATATLINETISLTKFIPDWITTITNDIYNLIVTINDTVILSLDSNILSSIQSSLTNFLTTAVKSAVDISSYLINFVLSVIGYIPTLVMLIVFTLISTYYLTKEVVKERKNESIMGTDKSQKMLYTMNQAKRLIINYGLSYMLLVFITFLLTLIGFSVLGVKYAFIFSLLSALFDLLPVVGMPLIYGPLALYYLANGHIFTALSILILFCIVFVSRQIIEPKLMSTTLGLNPVAVLAAIFIGLQVNGVSGMLFCMFLVVFYTVLRKVEIL